MTVALLVGAAAVMLVVAVLVLRALLLRVARQRAWMIRRRRGRIISITLPPPPNVTYRLDDGPIVELAEREGPAIFMRKRRHLADRLRTEATLRQYAHGAVLDADASTIQLHAQLRVLMADAQEQAQRMVSSEWLWHLRRVPNAVFDRDDLATTVPYDRWLVEAMSTLSATRGEGPDIGSQIAFTFSQEKTRYVLEFCATAIAVSEHHALLRRAGKGMRFVVKEPHHLAEYVPDPSLEEAIRLYDERNEHGDSLVGRAGAEVMRSARTVETALLRVMPRRHAVVEALRADPDERVLANWAVDFVEVDPAIELFGGLPAEEAATFWQAVLPLLVLLRLAFHRFSTITGQRNILRCGYLVCPRADLQPWYELLETTILPDVRRWLPAARVPPPEGIFDEWAQPAVSPVFPRGRGPVMRGDDSVFYLDIAAATHAFLVEMRLDASGGTRGNLRGPSFERVVQAVIDRSAWARPATRAIPAPGNNLYSRGRAVTDIDAWGEYDGELLLVSCKSYPYSNRYDAGDRKAVDARCLDLKRDAKHWRDKVAIFEAERVGKNYDFSGYRRLIGVVCTPFASFVHIGDETEQVAPGLRRVSSVEELALFVRRETTSDHSDGRSVVQM